MLVLEQILLNAFLARETVIGGILSVEIVMKIVEIAQVPVSMNAWFVTLDSTIMEMVPV